MPFAAGLGFLDAPAPLLPVGPNQLATLATTPCNIPFLLMGHYAIKNAHKANDKPQAKPTTVPNAASCWAQASTCGNLECDSLTAR